MSSDDWAEFRVGGLTESRKGFVGEQRTTGSLNVCCPMLFSLTYLSSHGILSDHQP